MKGWLLDTNVVSELAKPHGCDANVERWADAQDEDLLYISILTIGEYERGIANMAEDSGRRTVVTRALAALQDRFAGRIVPVSNDIVVLWGRVSGAIHRETRRWPSTIDTLLAVTAMHHDLCLVTRNVADVKDAPAVVFNPWTDEPPVLTVR